EFFDLEKEHLWPHVWQMAAREEELPNPGDFVEYEITGKSILLVRQTDGSIKALHNACRHRATELAKGSGRLPGGQLVCPFHGWRWNLDGSNSFVFKESAFDPQCLEPDDLRLRECLVETWSGHVWINMDLDAPPLMEALSPVAELLDGVGVGNMRVKWWKKGILNANWKMAQEAFFEAYHVMQTHPQLLMGGGEQAGEFFAACVDYAALKNGHARFQSAPDAQPFENGEQFIAYARLLVDGQDAMTLDRDVRIFEGLRNTIGVDNPDFANAAVAALYDYAAGAGIPMAPISEEMALWGGDVFMFPNYVLLPMYGNCLCYRSRPYNDDPEWCQFDVWSLTTYPTGQEPERAELLGVFDKNDTEHWGLIPRQDFSNIEAQQRGLHTVGFDHLLLSNKYEISIANMHEELDRRLADRM
ncbi:aromatic ring-hydroxylating oxygenase subunit alpha, partial [Mycobacterium sp.]|uniref:aromatic ring-hydroxylating oxygenase subunit alpha n=1 Tax=Mycobacterium sp. TaxID=1785 RepID=UPI003C75174F